ncbi:hypothetical protein RQP46_010680 [Phenoliferia psychrophenolica]
MSQGKVAVPVQTHQFPILDHVEIMEQCRAVQLVVTPDDLSHPTSLRVQHIYAHWLNYLVRISQEDITAAVNERLDLMDNPDLHREALFVGMFQITMDQLMVRAAVDSFSISDLIAPTTGPLVRNLSAIINFSLFEREQATEHLDPLLAEDDGLLARSEELSTHNQDVAERLQHEIESRRNNEPKAAAAQDRLLSLHRQLAEKSHLAKELQKEVEHTQQELKSLLATNDEVQRTITTNERELTRLKASFVQSPERLRHDITTLTANIEREQNHARSLEHKERQLQAKISAFSKYEQDLTGIIRVMDEWEIDMSKINEANSRYQNHVDELDSLLAEKTEIESNIELLSRRITNAHDELTRFGEKSERKRKANKERKKSLEEHYAQLHSQKGTLDMQGAEKNREAVELESQIRAVREELLTELDRGESEYKRIKDQVTLYSLRVNKALDSLNEVNIKPLSLSAAR